jgi:catechol 2,3-dioxygenase-like lactoylglutathione lyase family enzyme
MDATAPLSPRWRGVNHLALVTADMDTTVRFYVGVLGARLIATIGTPTFRHYFFEIGTGNAVAFFEYQGVELEQFAKPAGIPHPMASQFDHVSFALADEEALLELRDRLKRADCEVTDVVDHGIMHSIYFTDPNGIALEASWWTTDPTGRAELSFTDKTVFADATPVPAVRELAAGGLERIPATRLVGGFTQTRDEWCAPTS